MLSTLLSVALAHTPFVATYEIEEVGDRTKADSRLSVGVDLTGLSPSLGARFDLGHRLAAEGKVGAGLPLADRLKWTGGASLGLHVAPIRMQLGTVGHLDLRVGTGLKFESKLGGEIKGTPWDLGGWLSSTLEVSPDGHWTFYAGWLAQDITEDLKVVPTVGVRIKLH